MILIAYALFLHFVADFLLQTREMAKQKSGNGFYLSVHVMIQWFVMFAGLLAFLDPVRAGQVATINASLHGLIDASVWNLYKRYVKFWHNPETTEDFEYWEHQSFYTVIGIDQMLHSISICVAFGLVL